MRSHFRAVSLFIIFNFILLTQQKLSSYDSMNVQSERSISDSVFHKVTNAIEECRIIIEEVAILENEPSIITLYEELISDLKKYSSINSSFNLESIIEAFSFAILKYDDFRKKADGESFFLHILRTTHVLWFKGEVRSEDVIIASLLDHIHETDTANEELEPFGREVIDIISEDHRETISDEDHRRAHVEHAPTRSYGGRLSELAHAIDRVMKWKYATKNQIETSEFLAWIEELGAVLKGTNIGLEEYLDALVLEKRQVYLRY